MSLQNTVAQRAAAGRRAAMGPVRAVALGCALLLVPAGIAGCNASASFSAGGSDAKKPEPPPPPPPKEPKKPKEEAKQEEPEPEPAATEPEPAPEPKEESSSKVVTKGDNILLPGAIVFDSGQATLKEGEQNEEILTQLKAYLDNHPNVTLMRIEGHTDNVGKPEDNLELSGNRALTIKKALVERGVDTKRMIAVGFGERKPIASNDTDEGRAQNRRTQFKIAGLNGRNYMGLNPKGGGTEFK